MTPHHASRTNILPCKDCLKERKNVPTGRYPWQGADAAAPASTYGSEQMAVGYQNQPRSLMSKATKEAEEVEMMMIMVMMKEVSKEEVTKVRKEGLGAVRIIWEIRVPLGLHVI